MFKNQVCALTGMPGPNQVLLCDDYHVSYNSMDAWLYGCDTTAIVVNYDELFLILNGDHRDKLEEITETSGLQGCIDYFIENIHLANNRSEHSTKFCKAEIIGQDNYDRIRKQF